MSEKEFPSFEVFARELRKIIRKVVPLPSGTQLDLSERGKPLDVTSGLESINVAGIIGELEDKYSLTNLGKQSHWNSNTTTWQIYQACIRSRRGRSQDS